VTQFDGDRVVAEGSQQVSEVVRFCGTALEAWRELREDRSEFAGLDTAPDAEVTLFAKHLSGRNRHSKVAYGTEGGLFAQAGLKALEARLLPWHVRQ